MIPHIDLKRYQQKAINISYPSQTTIEEELTTSTETQTSLIWQVFDSPTFVQNGSIEKKTEDGTSADETFWFDVISVPEITEEAILSKHEIQMQIEQYEQKYRMTSQEFIQKYHAGDISDTFDMMDWIMLLDYQKPLSSDVL